MNERQNQRVASTAPTITPTSRYAGNPVLRMMGLPRFRTKLPSRNWLIFLCVTGSFAAAIAYDRRQKKKIQQKWCDTVAHLADQSLPTQHLPRHVTVFLAAPPGDYLLSAREHFKKYVRPILVAAALDWDVVEGRKEGEIQHKLAERIRNQRLNAEGKLAQGSAERSHEDSILLLRSKSGVRESSERGGDLVIGRHTWKEYIRGLHEGWLGPIDVSQDTSGNLTDRLDLTSKHKSVGTSDNNDSAPQYFQSAGGNNAMKQDAVSESVPSVKTYEDKGVNKESHNPGDFLANSMHSEPDISDEDAPKPPKSTDTPYISPSQYSTVSLTESCPDAFSPSVAVEFPHLLGFLNTPIRIWRFLNQRRIAEQTGKTVVSLIMADDESIRRFVTENIDMPTNASSQQAVADNTRSPDFMSVESECQLLLAHEELDWHKSARKPNSDEDKARERPWQEEIILDTRISQKMRTADTSYDKKEATQISNYGGSNVTGTPTYPGTHADNIQDQSVCDSDPTYAHTIRRPKGIDWKGGVDRRETVTLFEWIARWKMSDRRGLKPWEQGLKDDPN